MNNQNLDPLTGLLNNEALIKKLKSAGKVNYFLMNLDNFSSVNYAYGYETGNKILVSIANYLEMFKPGSASMYRFCSDRFILIDERNLDKKDVIQIAESILSFFSNTNIIIDDEIEFKISFTIGISIAKGLINITQAETAMKEIRKTKRNSFYVFDPLSKFVHDKQQKIYWMQKIKESIEEETIVAYFQPIINNHTEKIEKYECLARIIDDDEVISPFYFLEAARETGNISFITKALITQSFKKFSQTECDFSINITNEDLHLDYLETFLLKQVNKFQINPSRVVLEILENITSLDNEVILKQLTSLRLNGFKIAIDDFGAENSNYSRLLEIEPDFLKIDGIFIKNIVNDKKSQDIVESIVCVCQKNNIKVIAEYIHNKETYEKVKELGIDYSQGFYFGAPSQDLKDEG